MSMFFNLKFHFPRDLTSFSRTNRVEIENIINSGTKINIDYHLNDILDDDSQEEIYEYFLEDAETDDISVAHEEFDGDYSEDELRLMKIKFMSEMAN